MLVDKKIGLAKVMENDEMLEDTNEWVNELLNGSLAGLSLEITSENEYARKTSCRFPDCFVTFDESEHYKGLSLRVESEDDAGVICFDCSFYIGRGVMGVRYDPEYDGGVVHLTFDDVKIDGEHIDE